MATPTADAAFEEILLWKLGGAMAWHAALCAVFCGVWQQTSLSAARTSFSHASWLHPLAAYITALGVLYAQRRLLAVLDVPPLQLPRLRLHPASWVSLLASRCVLRTRKLADAADTLLLYAACTASGAYCVRQLTPPPALALDGGDAGRWLLAYGCVLGCTFATQYLYGGHNILSHPLLQRHRWHRVAGRLRTTARATLLIPSWALAVTAAASLALPLGSPGGVRVVAAAWRAALAAVFAWTAGGHLLEVVFTEPVAFAHPGDPHPSLQLLQALQHSNPLVREWALQDLVAVAEGGPRTAWRREAIFADDSGAAGWEPLTRHCLVEVADLSATVAAALPAMRSAPPARPTAQCWNVLALAGGRGGAAAAAAPGSAEGALAAWHLQARYQSTAWSARALAALAAASLREDAWGVAQLCSPNLADVVHALLGLVQAVQGYLAAADAGVPTPARGPLAPLWALLRRAAGAAPAIDVGQQADAAALALLDTAKASVYAVVATFGPVVAGLRPTQAPAVPVDKALLSGFLAEEE